MIVTFALANVELEAFILKLPIYYVVAFAMIEEIVKVLFMRRSFKSFKWIKNMVNDNNEYIA